MEKAAGIFVRDLPEDGGWSTSGKLAGWLAEGNKDKTDVEGSPPPPSTLCLFQKDNDYRTTGFQKSSGLPNPCLFGWKSESIPI